MNGRYRLLFTLLLYMLGDLLGMLAVGHPTGFGVWTLAICALVSLALLALASREREPKSQEKLDPSLQYATSLFIKVNPQGAMTTTHVHLLTKKGKFVHCMKKHN